MVMYMYTHIPVERKIKTLSDVCWWYIHRGYVISPLVEVCVKLCKVHVPY